jgi:hypothetical protein
MSAAHCANIVSDFLQIKLFELGFEAGNKRLRPIARIPNRHAE